MVVEPTSIGTDKNHGSRGLIARLRAALGRAVPTGYEDENGFHLGNEPVHEDESSSAFPVQDLNKFKNPN
jgi:hypothetical protein